MCHLVRKREIRILTFGRVWSQNHICRLSTRTDVLKMAEAIWWRKTFWIFILSWDQIAGFRGRFKLIEHFSWNLTYPLTLHRLRKQQQQQSTISVLRMHFKWDSEENSEYLLINILGFKLGRVLRRRRRLCNKRGSRPTISWRTTLGG